MDMGGRPGIQADVTFANQRIAFELAEQLFRAGDRLAQKRTGGHFAGTCRRRNQAKSHQADEQTIHQPKSTTDG